MNEKVADLGRDLGGMLHNSLSKRTRMLIGTEFSKGAVSLKPGKISMSKTKETEVENYPSILLKTCLSKSLTVSLLRSCHNHPSALRTRELFQQLGMGAEILWAITTIQAHSKPTRTVLFLVPRQLLFSLFYPTLQARERGRKA
ncbi:hypothetical protein NPIL_388381 [Nephila pilipes]|uniref:Uncharacterized protein n=1 Tax=Nephila pilipes TaxID=299642 RepID=A0A8X6NRX5_NEPPI|nr:hypothetical protein NPIL_388381 [Nephila pilipes]